MSAWRHGRRPPRPPHRPAALCLGTAVGSLTTPLTQSALGSYVRAPSLLGLVAVPLSAVAVYRGMSSWPERSRRQLGYLCSVLVGLAVAAVAWFMAVATSLCATWGEQCSPAEEAAIDRWAALGLVSLVAVPGSYAAADLATRRR
jgi:MFS family permease